MIKDILGLNENYTTDDIIWGLGQSCGLTVGYSAEAMAMVVIVMDTGEILCVGDTIYEATRNVLDMYPDMFRATRFLSCREQQPLENKAELATEEQDNG